jgi:hypothetical protein
MTIYPNLFIAFPWDFITLYFPLKLLVYPDAAKNPGSVL